MKNYLITGGAGFIGSHIAEKLVERGDNVTIIDDLYTGKKENLSKIFNKIRFIKGDILDYKLLENEFEGKDGIFHQAARASVQDSFKRPEEYFRINVEGTKNVFNAAKKYEIKVVYASSSSVYGNPDKIPIKEDSSKNPINPYAETKLEDEKIAEKFAKEGLKVIGLRYFNVFGERQSKEYAGVVKLFLERIQKKMEPKINGDGLQSRDFIFVGDVVSANITAMESNVNHAFFNVGTNSKISVLELAEIMIKFSGLNLKPIHGPALEGDVKITMADNSLIKKMLDWNSTITIQEWLKEKISKF